MEILLATSNSHKVKELLKILPVKTKTGKVLIYKTLADFPNLPPIVEDGKTLEENAKMYKKSLEDYKKSLDNHTIAYFENDILMKKVLDFLKANNNIAWEFWI